MNVNSDFTSSMQLHGNKKAYQSCQNSNFTTGNMLEIDYVVQKENEAYSVSCTTFSSILSSLSNVEAGPD